MSIVTFSVVWLRTFSFQPRSLATAAFQAVIL